MKSEPLYKRMAATVLAWNNCQKSNNSTWLSKHEERLIKWTKDLMPSGGGVDGGTSIDLDKSSGDKLVFTCGFHHMNDGGYTHWTEHTITIKGSLWQDISINISGRNDNNIKDYLHDLFSCCLMIDIDVATGEAMSQVIAVD